MCSYTKKTKEILHFCFLHRVNGGELFERVIGEDFDLSEKDAIIFMRQICEGVQHMHRNKVLHLDLKPENIMCVHKAGHEVNTFLSFNQLLNNRK